MTREEIREWLADWLADQLGISPDDIEMDRTLASYGLDVEQLEGLSSDIEEYFDETLEANAVRPRLTVSGLIRYLCELTGTDEEDDYESGALHGMEADNLLRDIGLQ
ncbi:MAG: phosphopantetheine-binding protein [Myxococcales bacterium]|nr:phosphopantetheine-binding protein [Myxococcales bacterium]